MARNRLLFEEAMKKAHNYAWDARWEEAAQEYERAIAEFPDHLTARLNLGMAYLELGQQAEALVHYQTASELAPEDPLPLEKVANIQERLGRTAEAAKSYARLAQVWENSRSLTQAISTWRKVIALTPDDAEAYSRLAKDYVRHEQADAAVAEYVAAARIHREKGDSEEAIRCCDSALALDPFNAAARSLREALSAKGPPQPARKEAPHEEEEQTPLSIATQKATARLAELIFEEQAQEPPRKDLAAFITEAPAAVAPREDSRRQLGVLLGRAINYQAQGVLDKAISDYRRALELGVDYPEIHFNLGVLYYKIMAYEQAIPHLQKTVEIPEYVIASYFALGQCYRAQGQVEDALQAYLRLLRVLDLQAGKPQSDDFLQLYQSLAGAQGKIKDRERAIAFIDALTHFLAGKDWRERLAKIREQLAGLATGDVMASLAEIVEVPGSDQVLEGLQRSRTYLAQKLPMAAIEECYWLLDIAPTYLPVHAHLAEIFLQEDKVEQAVSKYATIANTYQIRGDTGQAIQVYRRIVEIFPLDITVRPKLISLLTGRGQIDEALEEYMALADAYYQLAQVDKTLERYQEALALAARGSSERNWPLTILKKIADIYVQRLDWGRASAVYQEIKRLVPADGTIRYTLVDLYYKVGQGRRAEAELDELLSSFPQERRLEEGLPLIRKLAETRPGEAGLRRRAARLLLERGQKDEAIAELDALGEQQLEQGRLKEAIITIRQIIALNPRQVAAYQQLLRQLEAQAQNSGEAI